MNFRFFGILVVAACLIFCASVGIGQVYSYVDEKGVRVFTNTPRTNQVSDLKVTGVPPPPPAPNPAATKSNRTSQTQLQASNRPAVAGTGQRSVSRAATQNKPGGVDVDAIVDKYAAEFSLDPKLLRSMIATESGFNPSAVSPKGAQGLMQLMPETAARLGVNNPFDPEQNIWGGARYMRFLLDTFAENQENNLILSLAAYNAGENLVQRLGRIPDFRETNEYVRSIIERYGKRQMEVPLPAAPQLPVPTTFRYFDEKGVLILTNIPRVDRSHPANVGGGSNSNSR
jgi:soluble lytic murein transglycosylase-like protein